jgi:hypothetical protein
MSIKYSFLLPYLDRIPQFRTTLESFLMHGYDKRGDVELIVVEDLKSFKDPIARQALKNLIEEYYMFNIHSLIAGTLESYSPVMAYNAAAKCAKGEYFITSNPECCHQANVLNGFDVCFQDNPDSYVIASCLSVLQESLTMEELKTAYGKWYQHSVERNVMVHFCSAMSQQNFELVGGFDDNYKYGVCFEDDDFRNRIIEKKIPFVFRDDLVTVHLDHYKIKPPHYLQSHHTNKRYYESVWGTNGFTAEKLQVAIYQESEVTPP